VYRTLKTYVFPVVSNKLGKVIKYEANKMMSFIYLETLNIEWGQIDPNGNRRVNIKGKADREGVSTVVTAALKRAMCRLKRKF